jgi:hypothetical protein
LSITAALGPVDPCLGLLADDFPDNHLFIGKLAGNQTRTHHDGDRLFTNAEGGEPNFLESLEVK